ncbi:MAG: ribosome maturation factor RimP [Firmicutes bacterium]|nr:ribosome maturation factor RimP [Bacillota bacterium]
MKRSEVERLVTQLAQPEVEALGFDLIGVEFTKEGKHFFLRLFIDKPGGITIDDCQLVAQRINPILDERDPIEQSYIFEVSSPGAERPLKTERDFELSRGRFVHLTTYEPYNGAKEFEGVLLAKENGLISLQIGDGNETISIPEQKVANVRLAIRF